METIKKHMGLILMVWAISFHIISMVYGFDKWVPWVFGNLPQIIHLIYLIFVWRKLKKELNSEFDKIHPIMEEPKKYTLKELIEKKK